MHPYFPLIGTFIWLLIFGGVAFAMHELIRIDRKILDGPKASARVKQPPFYEHRALWICVIVGIILFPLIIGGVARGFAFGSAWFVVSFGFLPWLIVSTSVLNVVSAPLVVIVGFIVYALIIGFFALVFRHNQKSTYIALSLITVFILIPLYVLGFRIATSSLLGFRG